MLSHAFTCSRCRGSVQSSARPDRIDGRPVCGPCKWAPAAPTPAPEPPPAVVLPFPACASPDELDPHERRAVRRAA